MTWLPSMGMQQFGLKGWARRRASGARGSARSRLAAMWLYMRSSTPAATTATPARFAPAALNWDEGHMRPRPWGCAWRAARSLHARKLCVAGWKEGTQRSHAAHCDQGCSRSRAAEAAEAVLDRTPEPEKQGVRWRCWRHPRLQVLPLHAPRCAAKLLRCGEGRVTKLGCANSSARGASANSWHAGAARGKVGGPGQEGAEAPGGVWMAGAGVQHRLEVRSSASALYMQGMCVQLEPSAQLRKSDGVVLPQTAVNMWPSWS